MKRLSYTDIQSAEFGIIRNYIDWVTCLPWNKQGPDQMNLAYAEKVLNEDHYGLKVSLWGVNCDGFVGCDVM